MRKEQICGFGNDNDDDDDDDNDGGDYIIKINNGSTFIFRNTSRL